MPKKRVHEIAKEQGLTSKDVLQAFKDAGVYVKAASSTVEERDVRRAFPNGAPARATAGEAAKTKSSKGAVKSVEETTPAPDDAAKATAERDAEGKAKVPRARATKRTKEEADAAVAAAAAAKAEASTQKTRSAGGSAAKA